MILGVTERIPSDPLPVEPGSPSLAAENMRSGMRTIYGEHDAQLSSTLLLEAVGGVAIILDASHMRAVVETELDEFGHDTHTYWLDGTVPEKVFRHDTGQQRTGITTSLKHFISQEHQPPAEHNEVMLEVGPTEITNFYRWLGDAALVEVS